MPGRQPLDLPQVISSVQRDEIREFPPICEVFPTLDKMVGSTRENVDPFFMAKNPEMMDSESSTSFWEEMAGRLETNPSDEIEKWVDAIVEQQPLDSIDPESRTRVMELLHNALTLDDEEEIEQKNN